MVVEPRVKDFICTTAHPVGCAQNVKNQIEYVKSKGTVKSDNAPKKVLVIGASTGYGLASRIAVAFGYGADTLGVMFEKESNGRRTATAGFYNNRAFEEEAHKAGLYAKSINGDAFSVEIKEQVIETIKADMGKIDMIVYSLAAPRRTTPDGTKYTSVLKTVGEEYTNKTLVLKDNTITDAHITAANDDEINATIKVMGGEDWIDWMQALSDAGVLADNVITVAYSYIGPKITFPIYAEGSIGQAKKDLYKSADIINEKFPNIKAKIAINKALVTQSSAAIPIVPLYITLLYKVMKEKGLHEGCIEQMQRLFMDKILDDTQVDDNGFIRMDDWEMRDDVQEVVAEHWDTVNNDNVKDIADIDGYWEDFYNMFGFKIDGVDYIYRHPGDGTDSIINRRNEKTSLIKAKQLGIDPTYIYADVNEGWKISRFVPQFREPDYGSFADSKKVLSVLRKLHASDVKVDYGMRPWEDALSMQKLLTGKDPNCFAPHEALKAKIGRLYQMTLGDGVEKCFCHGDTYRPNWMLLPDGDVILIDWEYAGFSDPGIDVGYYIVDAMYDFPDAERFIKEYLGNGYDVSGRFHYMAYTAIIAYYWFVWALYRESCGADMGQSLENWRAMAEKYADYLLKE